MGFAAEATLYEFDESKTWKERGKGEVMLARRCLALLVWSMRRALPCPHVPLVPHPGLSPPVVCRSESTLPPQDRRDLLCGSAATTASC